MRGEHFKNTTHTHVYVGAEILYTPAELKLTVSRRESCGSYGAENTDRNSLVHGPSCAPREPTSVLGDLSHVTADRSRCPSYDDDLAGFGLANVVECEQRGIAG